MTSRTAGLRAGSPIRANWIFSLLTGTRMGEPALNPAVLDVIDRLPDLYDVPGLIPSISTIAPKGSEGFFARLAEIKHSRFGQGRFQLQFSIHSSDEQTRARLIPMPHWSFPEISAYGERFAEAEDRKITLNFALAEGIPIEAFELRRHFDPGRFLIKVTPINPTLRAAASGLRSRVDASHPERTYGELQALEDAGFDVLLSIGELEENRIGSNCGQFVQRILHGSRSEQHPVGSYTYWHPQNAS